MEYILLNMYWRKWRVDVVLSAVLYGVLWRWDEVNINLRCKEGV
jgi:hypothetical protein